MDTNVYIRGSYIIIAATNVYIAHSNVIIDIPYITIAACNVYIAATNVYISTPYVYIGVCNLYLGVVVLGFVYIKCTIYTFSGYYIIKKYIM